MVSRFTGAAVGVAVVGSLLSSVYKSRIDDATAPLSSGQAAKADGSLQGALEVAAQLPRAAGDALATAARDAFDAGARFGYVAIALLATGASLFAWYALRRTSSTG